MVVIDLFLVTGLVLAIGVGAFIGRNQKKKFRIGICACGHPKSFHDEAFGKCCHMGLTQTCQCQIYVDENIG